MYLTVRFLTLAFLCLTLVGCGGGGGGGGGGSPAATQSPTPSQNAGGNPSPAPSPTPDPVPVPPPPPPPRTHTISGVLTGLDGVILRIPGDEYSVSLRIFKQFSPAGSVFTLSGDGAFTLDQVFPEGEYYSLTIYSAGWAAYCALEGSTWGTMGTSDITDIVVTCESRDNTIFSVVTASVNTLVDRDINNPDADYMENNNFDTAQPIFSPVRVQGYLTFDPTEDAVHDDTFAQFPDYADYFAGTFLQNQVIELHIADNGPGQADLDLALYDASRNLVATSDSDGPVESLTIPADGDYFIHAYAYSGGSSYLMTISSGVVLPPKPNVSHETDASYLVEGEVMLLMDDRKKLSMASRSASMVSFDHSGSSRLKLGRFNPGATASALGTVGVRNTERFNSKLETLMHIKRLRQEPGVLLAEPNYRRQQSTVPNDTDFDLQWALQQLDMQSAWDFSTGVPGSGDVIVAVLDSGIYRDHPELINKLEPGYDFVSNSSVSGDGDGVDSDPTDPGESDVPGESIWHGTMVSGIIAAQTNNSDGMAGVSWGAKIMPIRVLAEGSGSVYDILQGMLYAAGLPNDSGALPARPAHIINLSLGGDGHSSIEQLVIDDIVEAGVLVVAASGNGGENAPDYPSAYEGVISVGAVGFDGLRTAYSNYGSTLSLLAPGGDLDADLNSDSIPDGIYTTSADDLSGAAQPDYLFGQGTSFSAPHVSGVLALMLAMKPDLELEAIEYLLVNGYLTDDGGDPGFDIYYGFGVLNAQKALSAVQDIIDSTLVPVEPDPVLVASPSVLDLDIASEGTITLYNHGGGNPYVSSIRGITESWLQVTTGSGGDLGTVIVTIDRTGLSLGNYSASLDIHFTTGDTITVPVNMVVSELDTSGETGPLYIMLISPDADYQTSDAFFNSTQEFYVNNNKVHMQLGSVRPGRYYVYAGSDIDNDRIICEKGESCGAWPTLEAPELVEITGSTFISMDRNFRVRMLETLPPEAGVPEGGWVLPYASRQTIP